MTLSEQRILFTRLLCEFGVWCTAQGYTLALDQVKRTQLEAAANASSGAGISNSLHLTGLAADMIMYVNGVPVKDSAAYEPLGIKWESMHPLNTWGGRFKKPDGGHFSSTRGGVR